jgi:hypothetical protein
MRFLFNKYMETIVYNTMSCFGFFHGSCIVLPGTGIYSYRKHFTCKALTIQASVL